MTKDSSDESNPQHRAKEIAAPAREPLSQILYELLKDKETRERVAAELGYSPNTLRAAIYSEKGSLDLMVAALFTVKGWSKKEVTSFIKKAMMSAEKESRVSQFEKRLRAIAEKLDETNSERLLTGMEIILSIDGD